MTQIDAKRKPETKAELKEEGGRIESAGLLRKILAHRFCRYCMEGASLTLSLAVILLGMLSILMTRPSVNLNVLAPAAEDWFKGAFAGRTAEIETYTARWIQEKQAFEIRAANIDVSGLDGMHQGIAEMRAEFALKEGLRNTPELTNLYIDGGALTIARDTEGLVQVGLGTPDTFRRVAPLWSSQTEGIKKGSIDRLERMIVKGVTVYINDETSDLKLSIAEVTGRYIFDGKNIDIESQGDIHTETGRVPYRLNVQTVPDRSAFSANLSIEGLRPIEIAPKRGRYAVLTNLDAPVTLHAEIKSVPVTGLQALNIDFSVGEGRLKTGSTYKPFSSAHIRADYDVPAQSVNVSRLDIESEALNIGGEGHFKNIGSAGSGFMTAPLAFELALHTFRLNPGKKYEGPITIHEGVLQGSIDKAERTLTFETLKLDFGDFQTDFKAIIAKNTDDVLTAINIDGDIKGIVDRESLLSFWPNDFVLGARNWIVKSLQDVDLSDLNLHLAMDEDDIRTGRIANEHLNLDFAANNMNIRYLRKMPWLRESSGVGRLKGNQFDFQVSGGHVDGLIIEKGSVTIPRLTPKGGDLVIEFSGRGPLQEMLRVSNFEPLQYAQRNNMTPSDFSGDGQIHLKITSPLLEHFDPKRIMSVLDGTFTNVSLPSGYGKFNLNDGVLSLHADNQSMEITGPIKIGTWQSNLQWNKTFGANALPGRYSLRGLLNRDDLDNFGVGLRRHFGGEIDVSILGGGHQLDAQTLQINADFKNADVNIGGLWNKSIGDEGALTGIFMLSEGNGGRLDDFKITSSGLALEGSVALASNYRLRSLDMSKAYIDGFIDASVQAKPTDDGVLMLNVAGKYLSVETWVDKAFKTQSSSVSAPLFMTANVDEMLLDENYKLENAIAMFSHTGTGVDAAKLTGTLPEGPFLAEISHDKNIETGVVSKTGTVRVEIPDAAKAAVTFLGMNSIKEGKLVIDGRLPPLSKGLGVNGSAVLTDFILVRAPAFTKILSLASLQGMADTLGGKGMQFDMLEMDFAIDNGVLKVRNGHASGPALGLTGEGDIGFVNKALDFNGVLVPAYTMNSILGDIPLIGDIMVGKKGEGMFALNYAIKGPFRATQVSVNPLSALTPGFLRRIFDVKREKITDSKVKDLIEEQRKD